MATKSKMTRANNSLVVSLDFDKRAYSATDRQTLLFSLTNESSKPVRVLKWYTPLDGVKGDMFHVEYAGKRAVYMGRLYKRAAPREADYITIKAGETLKHEMDFSESYGTYQ